MVMGVPVGETTSIYVDAVHTLEKGDYVRAKTKVYEVLANRIQARGRHEGRQHLTVLVHPPDHPLDPDAYVLELHWYSRNRKRS